MGVDIGQLGLHGLAIFGGDFVGVGEQFQVHLVRHTQCGWGGEERKLINAELKQLRMNSTSDLCYKNEYNYLMTKLLHTWKLFEESDVFLGSGAFIVDFRFDRRGSGFNSGIGGASSGGLAGGIDWVRDRQSFIFGLIRV